MSRPGQWLLAVLVTGAAACDGKGCAGEPPQQSAGSGEGSADVALVELEPNNTREQATRLLADRTFTGAVTSNDVDVFEIPAAEGSAVVTLTAQSAVLVEWSEVRDGGVSSRRVDAGALLELGPFARASGTLLSISGAPGAYELRLAPAVTPADPCRLWGELDTSPQLPGRLELLPGVARGCIGTTNDEDAWDIAEATLATLPDGFGIEVRGVEGVSLGLVLEDQAGAPIARTQGGPGETFSIPNFAMPRGATRLRLRVVSASGANERTPYEVAVTRLPMLNGLLEREPDDASATAFEIPRIDLVNGFLHSASDVDWYSLRVTEPTVMQLTVESPAQSDLVVQVPPSLPGALERVVDEQTLGKPERLCALRLEPTTPFIFSVRGRTVGDVREPYLMHFTPFDGAQYEFEPNDTPAAALVAGAGAKLAPPAPGAPRVVVPDEKEVRLYRGATLSVASLSAHISPPGDVDVFRLEVPVDPAAEATYVSTTIRVEPNGPADYQVEVVDGDGAVVGKANERGASESESLALDLPGGRYWVKVTLVAGDACEAPYQLSAARSDFPVQPPPGTGAADEAPQRAAEEGWSDGQIRAILGDRDAGTADVAPGPPPSEPPAPEPERGGQGERVPGQLPVHLPPPLPR